MKDAGQSFGLPDLERVAKEQNLCFEQEVKAFTAEDALTQLRAAEGGSLGQPPFVFAITPLPDPRVFLDNSGEVEEEAKCVCGAVAVQWRKDIPVCALHRNEENDE